jgi:hypothetical protein
LSPLLRYYIEDRRPLFRRISAFYSSSTLRHRQVLYSACKLTIHPTVKMQVSGFLRMLCFIAMILLANVSAL